MYKFDEIKRAHIELSTNCQAKCPMCARNNHGGLDNPLLPINDIDLDFFKKIITPEFMMQLREISVCGNFGDALLNKDLLDIVKYITTTNPKIHFDLHTNASLRTPAWWTDFAQSMPISHQVHFGIDGLEDTHHLYRIGTNFNKIIENAKAFIAAGGKARWNFITFKHNEHQLETAREMAKELGFDSFHEKQTSRFIGKPWFDVVDKDGQVIYKLENPSERKIVFIEESTVRDYKQVVASASIECEIEDTKSVFIDGMGYLFPCCFVAGVRYHYSTPDKLVHNYRLDNVEMLNKIVDKFGGIEQLNLRNRSIQEIVSSDTWQTVWDESFKGEKLPVCARTCGKFKEPVLSQCRDQFLDLSEFDD
jgi:MoaA/NifB/PqqE/SkfB family radical SAM enzyme